MKKIFAMLCIVCALAIFACDDGDDATTVPKGNLQVNYDFSALTQGASGGTLKFYVYMYSKLGLFGYENVEFVVEEKDDKNIFFKYDDDQFIIYKSYSLLDEDYILQTNVSIQPKGKMSILEDLSLNAYILDMSSLDIKNSAKKDVSYKRDQALNEYVVYYEGGTIRKNKVDNMVY